MTSIQFMNNINYITFGMLFVIIIYQYIVIKRQDKEIKRIDNLLDGELAKRAKEFTETMIQGRKNAVNSVIEILVGGLEKKQPVKKTVRKTKKVV